MMVHRHPWHPSSVHPAPSMDKVFIPTQHVCAVGVAVAAAVAVAVIAVAAADAAVAAAAAAAAAAACPVLVSALTMPPLPPFAALYVDICCV